MLQLQSPPCPVAVVDGREVLYFVGTGYLGLHAHPEVVRAAQQAAADYGLGTATSRAGFGSMPPHVEVERNASLLFGTDDAIYLPTGYAAPETLCRGRAARYQLVLIDEHAHDCLHAAAHLCWETVVRFRHCDTEDLEQQVAKHRNAGSPLVMTDGVFAATGDLPPLAEYVQLLEAYDGPGLLVDDAHGFGVLGENGRGVCEHMGLLQGGRSFNSAESNDSIALYVCGTLSKAFGGYGGIIPGEEALVSQMRKTSPWYAAASPLPPPIAAATAQAIAILQRAPELRERLAANVDQLKQGLRSLGLEVDDSPVPVVCLKLESAARMQSLQEALIEKGIAIAYLPKYAGLGSDGGLRIALFATHTQSMIERLLDGLRRLL